MFHQILEQCKDKVVGVAIFPSLKSERFAKRIGRLIYIDGWHALLRLAVHALKHFSNCIVNSPPHFFNVEQVFQNYPIPMDYFPDPNHQDCIERIKELKTDVIFNNYGRILTKEVLSVAPLGVLNRHTSKLPEFRGMEPVFHALLAGEKEIGVTIHRITDEIDAGEVYAQASVPALPSVWECYRNTFKLGAEVFLEALKNLQRRKFLKVIDPSCSKYYKFPTREEIMKFRKKGIRYL